MLVSEFVERALYDPESGFYETGGRAGRRGGSFLTSPEVGPLFGTVVARALCRWWLEAGEPDEWIVVDAGAGPGTLARSILTADLATISVDGWQELSHDRFRGALRLVCVERTAAQRDLHPDGVASVADLPDAADVIVANELLDNLPFDLIERTAQGWSPVTVGADGTTSPDSGGPRIPVASAATAWVLDARRRLRPGGRLVCFDYADTTAALMERPWTQWVRAFAGQEELSDPFESPGSRDVTVVVPHDQLPTPTRATDQADWLRTHGIDELVAEGRAVWAERAAAPDVAALTMRSRTNESEALCDPGGLGGFWVGEWAHP